MYIINDGNISNIQKVSQENINNSENFNVITVSDDNDLRAQINAAPNATIKLNNDITIYRDLTIKKDTSIDLNGFNLRLADPNIKIIIGESILKGSIPYQVYHPGHYELKVTEETVLVQDDEPEIKIKIKDDSGIYSNDKIKIRITDNSLNNNKRKTITKTEDVWIPGYYETKYKYIYDYPEISVKFQNGIIDKNTLTKNALDGASASKNAYWRREANGEDGKTPTPMFKLISGNLVLKNLTVLGCDGGNGGDATYSALWHTPFLGINGGDGGNGGCAGNGGDIFCSEKGTVTIDKNTNKRLYPGEAGIPGKGSEANPNYWLIPSFDGEDGEKGRNGKVINNNEKLFISSNL